MAHPASAIGLTRRRGGTLARAAAIATLALGLAAAGCGSGAHTQTGHDAVNEAQPAFIARANSICGRLNRQFKAEKPAGIGISELVRVIPHRAILEAQNVRELKGLAPPAQLAHDWQQIVDYRQTLALELTQLGQAARARNTHAIHVLVASKKRLHPKLRAVALQAGFAECAIG